MKAARIVDWLLGTLAVAALIIGIMVFGIGPHGTASLFADLLVSVGIQGAYDGGLNHANSDSEMRFYSVFWFGFGVWILDRLRSGPDSRAWVMIALAMFWVGGLGRLLSYVQTGTWPDPLFIGLMWIELVAPLLVLALHLSTPDSKRKGSK